jgi:hypothetical protein
MRFGKFVESSYTPDDVPDKYFVAGSFSKYHPDVPKQLANLELSGMSGVSSSENIIRDFFGVAREMLLVMDGYHFEKLNKLSRVQYNNPEYLTNNNLNALLRLWSHKPEEFKSNWDSIRTKLSSYLRNAAESLTKKEPPDSYGFPSRYAYDRLTDFQKKCAAIYNGFNYDGGRDFPQPNKIKNTWDFARWLQKGASQDQSHWKIDLTLEEAHQIIVAMLKKIGETYSDEFEWRVKNKTTKIPQGSELYLLVPSIDQKTWSNYIQNKLNSLEKWGLEGTVESMSFILDSINRYKLNRLYNLSFIQEKKFKQIGHGHISYQQVQSLATTNPFETA